MPHGPTRWTCSSDALPNETNLQMPTAAVTARSAQKNVES
jgi:hypothetical protein